MKQVAFFIWGEGRRFEFERPQLLPTVPSALSLIRHRVPCQGQATINNRPQQPPALKSVGG